MFKNKGILVENAFFVLFKIYSLLSLSLERFILYLLLLLVDFKFI